MLNASDYTNLLHQLEQFFADAANQKPVAKHLDPGKWRDCLSLDLPTHGAPLTDLQYRYCQLFNLRGENGSPQLL